jgi:hypothetical protein
MRVNTFTHRNCIDPGATAPMMQLATNGYKKAEDWLAVTASQTPLRPGYHCLNVRTNGTDANEEVAVPPDIDATQICGG